MNNEKFVEYLVSKGKTANTISAYSASVLLYQSIFKDDISVTNLIEFRKYLIKNFKPMTVNLRIVGINTYLKFLGLENLKIKTLKIQRNTYLDNIIDNSQYERLKSFVNNPHKIKWYFIIWTLAATGVRISELVRFDVQDVKKGYVEICSKGEKYRRIFFPKSIRNEIERWCFEEGRTRGPLFLNRNNERITPRGVAKGLERIAIKCKIDKALVHPHAFRHLFAKNFISKRQDISMLADLLGHTNLETTKIYLRCTANEQQKIIDDIVIW